MAEPVQSGILDPLLGAGFFSPNLSLEDIKRRRAIAGALASRARPFPKTIGEGMTYFGESLAEAIQDSRLANAEKGYNERYNKAAGVPGTGDALPAIPATTTAGTGADEGASSAVDPAAAAITPSPAPGFYPGGDDEAIWNRRAAGIGGIESGGARDPYQALGSVTPKGDRAYGKYQVMGRNIPEWTQAAFGAPLTPQQFLASPEAQDDVFRNRFGGYVDKYGEEGAARAWYGGERGMKNPNATDMHGRLTVGGYGRDYVNRLGGAGAPAPNSGAAPAGATPDGATFAEEGGPNPPIVTADIKPMPTRVADASGRPAAAPTQPTATPGGTLEPVIPESLPARPAPMRSERLTPNEQHRLNILRQFPGDPRAVFEFQQAQKLGEAARNAEYEREKAEHDVYMRAREARETARQTAITNAPKARLELQKEAAAVTAAQAAEQARLQWGSLPAPVQKDLFDSRDAAKAASGSIGALNNAEAVLNAGTAIGPGSALALAYHKTRAFAGNKESERILANTQSFQASLGPAVMAAVKSYGGPQVSNTDREYAAMMTGSDVTLTEPAVRKILDIARRSAKAAMEEHRAKADEHAKDAPALRKFLEVADPLEASPKMSEGAKPAAPAAAGKTYKEGDIARGKAGQPDLIRRDGKWVPL